MRVVHSSDYRKERTGHLIGMGPRATLRKDEHIAVVVQLGNVDGLEHAHIAGHNAWVLRDHHWACKCG